MSRTGPSFSGPGMPVWGEYLNIPQECDTATAASQFGSLFDAWPYLPFWQAIPKATLWNPSRTDAPAEFRRDPHPAGGLYRTDTHEIQLNINYSNQAIIAHECGHHAMSFYNVGPGRDQFGVAVWAWYVSVKADDVEQFASDFGRLLRGQASDPPPAGFAQVMDIVRRYRGG